MHWHPCIYFFYGITLNRCVLRWAFTPVKFQVHLTCKKIIPEAKAVAVLETDVWQSPLSKNNVGTVSRYIKSCLGNCILANCQQHYFPCSFTIEEQIIVWEKRRNFVIGFVCFDTLARAIGYSGPGNKLLITCVLDRELPTPLRVLTASLQ